MESLKVLISWPGAIIFVCLTILLLVVLSALVPTIRTQLASGLKARILNRDFSLRSGGEHTEVIADARDQKTEKAPTVAPSEIKEKSTPLADTEYSLLSQMELAGSDGNLEAVVRCYEKLKGFADLGARREVLETSYLFARLHAGDERAEQQLIELVTQNPDWSKPPLRLAALYFRTLRFDEAVRYADLALARVRTDEDRVESCIVKVDILIKQELIKDAIKFLHEHLAKLQSDKNRAFIWEKISEIFKDHTKSPRKVALALERALQCDPANADIRFKLASTYADYTITQHLAMLHYEILCEQTPQNGAAFNNLGVSYGELGLLGLRIGVWHKAKKFEPAFPSGNLADELAKIGFYAQAREVLDSIPSELRSESRPLEVTQELMRLEDEEGKREKDVRLVAEKMHRIVRAAYANDAALLDAINLDELIAEFRGGVVKLFIDEIKSPNRISGKYFHRAKEYQLTANVRGALIWGMIKERREPNALLGKVEESHVLGAVVDRDTLLLLIRSDDRTATEARLTRIS